MPACTSPPGWHAGRETAALFGVHHEVHGVQLVEQGDHRPAHGVEREVGAADLGQVHVRPERRVVHAVDRGTGQPRHPEHLDLGQCRLGRAADLVDKLVVQPAEQIGLGPVHDRNDCLPR
jgi:hypothetical protein